MAGLSRLAITMPAVLFGVAVVNLYLPGKYGGSVSYVDIAGCVLGLALVTLGRFADVTAKQRALEAKVGALERALGTAGDRS